MEYAGRSWDEESGRLNGDDSLGEGKIGGEIEGAAR